MSLPYLQCSLSLCPCLLGISLITTELVWMILPARQEALGSVTWQSTSTRANELITTKPNFKRVKDAYHTVHCNLPK